MTFLYFSQKKHFLMIKDDQKTLSRKKIKNKN